MSGGSWRGWLTFAEAFLTVEVSGLGGVMAQAGTVYTWPSLPTLTFITLGAVLAGIRRVQSLYTTVPTR